MDVPGQEAIIRAVRRLTVAVWALVIVLVAWACLYAADAFFPTAPNSRLDAKGMPDETRAFRDAPIEQQIRESTVIVLAGYEKHENTLRCPIMEILKHASGVTFHLKVGDEIDWCRLAHMPSEVLGDGQIFFFQGNPARPRLGITFSRGRLIDKSGFIPMEELREMIKAEAE